MSTSNCNPAVTHNVSAPDENSYPLGPTNIAFLLSQTPIETEAAMKSRILDIQTKACKVSLPISPLFTCDLSDLQVQPYPCVLHLGFVK